MRQSARRGHHSLDQSPLMSDDELNVTARSARVKTIPRISFRMPLADGSSGLLPDARPPEDVGKPIRRAPGPSIGEAPERARLADRGNPPRGRGRARRLGDLPPRGRGESVGFPHDHVADPATPGQARLATHAGVFHDGTGGPPVSHPGGLLDLFRTSDPTLARGPDLTNVGRRSKSGSRIAYEIWKIEASLRMSADPAEPAEERPGLIRVVPNLMTSVRLALGVAFPFIPAGSRWAALLAAAATELLDGQVARLLRVRSTTGRILDPIADKVFVASVLATLMWDGTMAPWQVILVTSRDIIVTAGALVAARRGPSALRRCPVAPGEERDGGSIPPPPRGRREPRGGCHPSPHHLGPQSRGGHRLRDAVPVSGQTHTPSGTYRRCFPGDRLFPYLRNHDRPQVVETPWLDGTKCFRAGSSCDHGNRRNCPPSILTRGLTSDIS